MNSGLLRLLRPRNSAGAVVLTLWLAANGSIAADTTQTNTPPRAEGAALPTALYEEWRQSQSPADASTPGDNPPSLLWPSVKHWEGRDVLYRVQISDDPTFPANRTRSSKPQRACFYNPHSRFKPGRWYWRYEVREGAKTEMKGTWSFVIHAETPVFETPTFEEFVSRIASSHPRVMTQGRSLADVRRSAPLHPLYGTIIRKGKAAAASTAYDGPLESPDRATARALDRKASAEVRLFQDILEAYVLSGDPDMRKALLHRIQIMLKWPTNDLLGSQVLTALAKAYDVLQVELPGETRSAMLDVISAQLNRGLSRWPGNIEGRQVENHFWQMELAGNFAAALATVQELDAGRDMLEYTYELFLARFPNLAASDGGWAEGLGYFGVNKSAVVDMALLMKKVGHVDVFQMQWYRTLANYYIYHAPLDGAIDGFGDQHDRIENGNIGAACMFVLGHENRDARALFRAARLMKSDRDVEPWYQIVNGINFDPRTVPALDLVSQDCVFRGVGLSAMHTDVLHSGRDTAVYFRASPFGAKGHMHANQNAFNISHNGERLFYSSGYYTTFADPHSLQSYRHTRAHNAILVNGCGQAFGHEGYGWIKRYATGKDISYVCGDATMAYRPVVDTQFIGLLRENHIEPKPEHGFGDGRLKLFERHLAFIRPGTVVIYDVLESEAPSSWTLLLHAMKQPSLDSDGALRLKTGSATSVAHVIGSQPLASRLTDQFHTPAVDILKKYSGLPNQHHASYESTSRSSRMRFLSVLQVSDAGQEFTPLMDLGQGRFKVNGITLQAELDVNKPAWLSAETDSSKLFINRMPAEVFGQDISASGSPATLLAERVAGQITVAISTNLPPGF